MSGAVPPRPDLGPGELEPGPPQATWKAIEALPVGLIALGATAIVGAIIAHVVAPGATASQLKDNPNLFTYANLAQELLLLGAVVVWVRFVKHAPLAALGIPRRLTPVDAAVGLAAGVSMVFAAGLVLQVVHAIVDSVAGHSVGNPAQVPKTVTGGLLAMSGVVVIVLAPMAEETFFRGFLYKALRRRFSVWPAAVVSGAIFGAVHFSEIRSLLIIPSLVVVGIVLAMVYERRQSLLASIATHATFNLVGFIFIVISRSKG
jgi:membrane protease YdiL (CAAX protease family)